MVDQSEIGIGHSSSQFAIQAPNSSVDPTHDIKLEEPIIAPRLGFAEMETEGDSDVDPLDGESSRATHFNIGSDHISLHPASFGYTVALDDSSQSTSSSSTDPLSQPSSPQWCLTENPPLLSTVSSSGSFGDEASPSLTNAATVEDEDDVNSNNGAAHYTNTSDIPMPLDASDREQEPPDHEMSNDIDDDDEIDLPSNPDHTMDPHHDWHSGDWGESAEKGNLIERSDLYGFALDRLPGSMFCSGDDFDHPLQDADDTEKFYVSDDEISFIHPRGHYNLPPTSEHSTIDDLDSDGSMAEQSTVSFLPPSNNLPIIHDDHNDHYDDDYADDDNELGEFSMHTETFERNLTVDQFIRQWFIRSRLPHQQLGMKEPFIPISTEAARVLDWDRPAKISRPDNHQSRSFDIQNIPWSRRLKVRREDARVLRDKMYTSYHNLRYQPHGFAVRLPHDEEYFKPKTMYTKYKASMAHFQLRNLMSVTASNTIQYAHRSKIYSITPFYNEQNCLMDLSQPSSSTNFFDAVKISTMKAKHGITMTGGFCGEYAFRGELSDFATVEGHITKNMNGITNHIDIVKHRTSHSPQAIIASNDMHIRTLDCETNQFVQVHKFAQAINCTDTSPDGRLRVIVGDSADSWVIDGETGKPLQPLSGHRDYGFACAWSPDMLHIATSNQDKTVNIWDARMWRILQTIDSDVAGYRSLRFSPVGGGPRTLLMCEPADRISILNAQTYQSRQILDFFGEVGGAEYSPDGGRIWAANMDAKFGGFMEFDRCQWGQEFGVGQTRRRRIESRGDVYYPDLPNEWIPEVELDDDARCVVGSGERKQRFQRLVGNQEHDSLCRFLG